LYRERCTWWCAMDVGLSFTVSWFASVCPAQLLPYLGQHVDCCTICIHAVLQTMALSTNWNHRQTVQGATFCHLSINHQSVQLPALIFMELSFSFETFTSSEYRFELATFYKNILLFATRFSVLFTFYVWTVVSHWSVWNVHLLFTVFCMLIALCLQVFIVYSHNCDTFLYWW